MIPPLGSAFGTYLYGAINKTIFLRKKRVRIALNRFDLYDKHRQFLLEVKRFLITKKKDNFDRKDVKKDQCLDKQALIRKYRSYFDENFYVKRYKVVNVRKITYLTNDYTITGALIVPEKSAATFVPNPRTQEDYQEK